MNRRVAPPQPPHPTVSFPSNRSTQVPILIILTGVYVIHALVSCALIAVGILLGRRMGGALVMHQFLPT